MTANGMIARKNLETPWSEDEFASYCNKVKEVGAFIIGNVTFSQFRESDFEAMGNPLTIVLTTKSLENTDKVRYANSAEEAFEVLEKEGFKTALVTGGAQTNKAFAKYIDEIYLDIEPLIFGEGIPLFSPVNFEYKLKFISFKMLSAQTIQLHYKCVKV